MNVKEIKKLSKYVEQMDYHRGNLIGCVDSFGKTSYKSILMMIAKMPEEDVNKMFIQFHQERVQHYESVLKSMNIDLNEEV